MTIACSTSGFEPLLREIRARSEEYFGDRSAAIEPVKRLDRPFSMLLRLRVDAREKPTHAYLKIFKPRPVVPYEPQVDLRDFVECEFASATRVHEALRHRRGLLAPRPVAVFPDACAMLTEEVEGQPLDRLLRSNTSPPHLIGIAARIGAWVSAYQRMGGTEPGTLALDDQRSYIDDRLRFLTPHFLSERERAETLDLFDRLAAGIKEPARQLVPIHADLCPSNILVTPNAEVAVLDFAMAKDGTLYHDLSHLFLHFEFLRWRSHRKGACVPSLQSALLRGFGSDAAPDDPLFQVMLLQHVVCHVTLLATSRIFSLPLPTRPLVRRRWQKCLTLVDPQMHQGPGVTRPMAAAN